MLFYNFIIPDASYKVAGKEVLFTGGPVEE